MRRAARRAWLIGGAALAALARPAHGSFVAFDCSTVPQRVPKSDVLSRRAICVSQSVLVVLALLAFVFSLSGVYRLLRARPKWFGNRLLIVLLSAVESGILFVNFGFEAQKSIIYIVHFLQNLTLTAVTYHLFAARPAHERRVRADPCACVLLCSAARRISYATVLARKSALVPRVILPCTLLACAAQIAGIVYILAGPTLTEPSGLICQSGSWFALAAVGVALTIIFTIAGTAVYRRIARVARRSFAAAFLRRKMSKLRNLIVVYLFSAIVSMAFYSAMYYTAKNTHVRPPCNALFLDQDSATLVFIEHILIHVVTFFLPLCAFVLQFSTGPYTVEGETIEINSRPPADSPAYRSLASLNSAASSETSPLRGFAHAPSFASQP